MGRRRLPHRPPQVAEEGFSVSSPSIARTARRRPALLDWKVVARADKWLIKQFEEETNLRATIVLDVSRSMNWTAIPSAHQARYAERVTAAVAGCSSGSAMAWG